MRHIFGMIIALFLPRYAPDSACVTQARKLPFAVQFDEFSFILATAQPATTPKECPLRKPRPSILRSLVMTSRSLIWGVGTQIRIARPQPLGRQRGAPHMAAGWLIHAVDALDVASSTALSITFAVRSYEQAAPADASRPARPRDAVDYVDLAAAGGVGVAYVAGFLRARRCAATAAAAVAAAAATAAAAAVEGGGMSGQAWHVRTVWRARALLSSVRMEINSNAVI
jgi:hypothetical protein